MNKPKSVTRIGTIGIICFVLISGGCKDRPTIRSASAELAGHRRVNQKILVLHSYHPEYQWVASINRGISMVIPPDKVDIEYYYMDTKNHPDPTWREQTIHHVIEAVKEWSPDVVITADDNAQEDIGKMLVSRNICPVVFCGVNRNVKSYGYEAGSVTGVLERPHFNQSIRLLQKIAPKVRTTLVLSDTGYTSAGALAHMQAEARELTNVQILDWHMAYTFDDWKKQVLRAQAQADALAVYTYHTIRESETSTRIVPAAEVMEWTVNHTTIPIVGFVIFAVDDGSLCGVLESGVEQGVAAARMALKILQGYTPSKIPIETGLKGQRMINLEVAGRLGIEVDPMLLKTIDVVIYDVSK